MTTLANQSPAPVDQPKLSLVNSSTGTENNSGSITRGGINPSAAAMLILYQVMAMYSKITGINAQEQKTQISATQSQAKSEAKAVSEAGYQLGKDLIIGASVALGLTLAGTAVGAWTTAKMKENNDDTDLAEKELVSVKKINEVPPSEAAAGTLTKDDPVMLRMNELKKGQYETEHSEDVTKEAIKHLASDKKYDFGTFKERLNRHEESLQTRRNTNALNNENARQRQNTFSTMINQFGQTGNSIAQGAGNMQKSEQDAYATLDRSAAQMSQQSGSSIAEAKSKSADAQNAVIHVLNAIRQASSNV